MNKKHLSLLTKIAEVVNWNKRLESLAVHKKKKDGPWEVLRLLKELNINFGKNCHPSQMISIMLALQLFKLNL